MLISIELTDDLTLNFDPQTGFTAIWGWHHRDAIQWHRYGGKTIRRILRKEEKIKLQPKVYDLLPSWAKDAFEKAECEERLIYNYDAMQDLLEITGEYYYGGDICLPTWCWAMVPKHWPIDEEAVQEAHEEGQDALDSKYEQERKNDARLYG